MVWTAADQNLKMIGFTKEAAEELRDNPSSIANLPENIRVLLDQYRYAERPALLDEYIRWVDISGPNDYR